MAEVVALVTEHRNDGDGDGGFHGALRAIGLDPAITIDDAEGIASSVLLGGDDLHVQGGLVFIAGVLVGAQLPRGGDGG